MTAAISIRDVSHDYAGTQALTNINLDVDAGRFVVLLGPSGCGKTTLLSILGGFIKPSVGSVLLNGKDVTAVPPSQRATTTMFQDYALFPHMHLLDNVGFGLRMRRIGKAKRHRKARELLSMVGLEHEWQKKPHELSGGQRQRIALARALAVEPAVLLLDEPLGALDLKLRRQMQDELKAIQKHLGTTFIHVTHDQEEAMVIADDIVVMNAGHLEDTGTPEKIYLKPASIFSATFMGEVNMISAKVEATSPTTLTINSDYGAIELPVESASPTTFKRHDPVVLTFRPEHIETHQTTTVDTIDLGEATLTTHAFFGAHQRCHFQATNGQTFTIHLPQQTTLQTGQSIHIKIRRSAVTILPAES
ncbi:MAG: ABC transporter ATP-binding protein [Granulosicoccus sp.]